MDIGHVTWRKASYSGGTGGNCIEAGVTATPESFVAVRDSKDPGGSRLAFTSGGWEEFTRRIKRGVLDRG
jgi:Domain of unknown function (DUF397)